MAISPAGVILSSLSATQIATNFFEAYLAAPVVLGFGLYYKIMYRTKLVGVREIDLVTGRNEFESEIVRRQWKEDKSEWPRWKVIYKTMC